MPKVKDVVRALRSKNAGPTTLAIDILFRDQEAFDTYAGSPRFHPAALAEILAVDEKWIMVSTSPQALGVKVTLPRPCPSAAVGDPDVYACQYYLPMAELELE